MDPAVKWGNGLVGVERMVVGQVQGCDRASTGCDRQV